MEVRNNKLQAKDLINVGIFTAIYFVVFFAGMMLGYIPIFIPLLGLVCPILCGIPFMLYLTKVKKFGMVSLTGIILGLLNVLIGAGVLVLIFGVVFGILGDLVLKAGKYQSWKCTLLGNGVFSLWIMGAVCSLPASSSSLSWKATMEPNIPPHLLLTPRTGCSPFFLL